MSVGIQPGEGSPGADLVLPCLTVVPADALVLPTDGANCSCTIFLGPNSNDQVLAQDATYNECS